MKGLLASLIGVFLKVEKHFQSTVVEPKHICIPKSLSKGWFIIQDPFVTVVMLNLIGHDHKNTGSC